MTNRIRRVVITGGGSGGHVYPLLAVVKELERLAISEKLYMEIFYIGPKDQFADILRNKGVIVKNILSGKMRRYASFANILDIPKFFIGIIQSFFILYWLMPDVIFSKGGSGALPIVFAGWFYQVKIMIHESDAVPGLTNAISSHFASRIAVTFEKTASYFDPTKTAWTGTPMRREIIEGTIEKNLAKKELDFKEKEPLVVILGGSQGSKRINDFIVSNLKEIIKETQILHQAGRENYTDAERLARAALVGADEATTKKYKIVPYLYDDIKIVLSASDMAVARAGSGTISELTAFGIPAILIPLAGSAQDHQRANAYECSASGGGVVIEEVNLVPSIFLSQLRSILKNPQTLKKMSDASKKFFKPGAAEIIAQELINIS